MNLQVRKFHKLMFLSQRKMWGEADLKLECQLRRLQTAMQEEKRNIKIWEIFQCTECMQNWIKSLQTGRMLKCITELFYLKEVVVDIPAGVLGWACRPKTTVCCPGVSQLWATADDSQSLLSGLGRGAFNWQDVWESDNSPQLPW